MRLIFGLVLLVAAPAGAEEKGDVEIAKSRFALGDILYRSDRYREAVEEFEAARKLTPRPDLDYNIARCYERLREWDHAIEAYTRYIESTPTPLDAEQMLTHIDEIKEVREKERKSAPPTPPRALPSATAQRDTRAPRIVGIVLGGVGVVGIAVGVAFGVAANGTADQLTVLDRSMGRFDPGRAGDLQTQRILEGTFLGIGCVALVAGVVSYTVGHVMERRGRPSPVSASAGGIQVTF